jgi:hypothetical protein
MLEEFKDWLVPRDGTPKLLKQLEDRYPAAQVLGEEQTTPAFQKWEKCGLYLMDIGRVQDAIAVFTRLYELVVVERPADHPSIARGSSLVWLSDC